MGTFAGLFREGRIPENKKDEFIRRVELLFQAGGMMEMQYIQLFGKKVATLRKASMHDDGMNFFYNYFEEGVWENAGFDKESMHIWSGKIGWDCFHTAVVAAYVLEALYLDGPAVPIVDMDLVAAYRYTGWINYLFQEHFLLKNRDPWQLFEFLHEQTDVEDYEWGSFTYDGYGALGCLEISAVLNGTDAAIRQSKPLNAIKVNKKETKDITVIEAIVLTKHLVEDYRKNSSLNEEEQLSLLLEMIRASYGQDVFALMDKYEDERLKDILFCAFRSEVPAFIIKVLAETYDKDFWELWIQNKDVVRRRWKYGSETIEASPISTAEFFQQNPDDMILFWEEDERIEFSDDLRKWFKYLKIRYDELMETNLIIENPLNWIINLMEYADENYFRIYTMNDFFGETMEHLTDLRYQVLWKIYDDMLHDPEMEEAGSVIFVPDEPEYENMGVTYIGEQPRRRLQTNWGFMSMEKKNNKARKTLRRYMALVANRRLRQAVFGF